MVYCTKCGTKNKDDADACKKCGAKLHPPIGKTEDWCFGPREERERHVDECFGIPRFGAILGIAIGLIIIFYGISVILSRYYRVEIEVWPIAVIIFGLLIIIAAFSAYRRR